MNKLEKIEENCLNYIESVKAELYHANQSDDVMSMMEAKALETAIKHLENMLAVIQKTNK